MLKYFMSARKKIFGGGMAAVGFLLSPLSWWNDLLINIPLAYFLASPLGLINRKIFIVGFVGFYWLTNLLGFVLMHLGLIEWRGSVDKTLQQLLKENFPMTFIYTLLMVLVVQFGWVKLPWDYFK